MQNRKEQIERICDAHLRELLRITRQEPTRFNNMDYKKKFLVLAANEQMLIRSYRRQNKLSLRMKGITQSYYQYDSELYKQAKGLIAKIKKETIAINRAVPKLRVPKKANE